MKLPILLLLAVAAASLGCFQPYTELYPFKTAIGVKFEAREKLASRMKQVPVQRDARVERVVEMFREAGCKELYREEIHGSPTPNVICRLRGRSRRRIVVAAHHVLARGGKGIIDDWSGTALLPALYASISDQKHEHTYEFIAFASSSYEGDASYQHLRKMSSRARSDVVAMIWLDMLGMGSMASWPSRSDLNLRMDFESAAKSIGVHVEARDLYNAARIHDGSRAFRWSKVPTLFVHSVDIDAQRILREPHWDNDPANLDYDAYFDTYRALAVYLGYLDRTLIARNM